MPILPLPRHRAPFTLLVIATAVVAACSKGAASSTGDSLTDGSTTSAAEDSARPALALPVVADDARSGDLILRVSTTGQIHSDAVVKLRAEVAGAVTALQVRPGQTVTQGQELLRLDPYPFELAVREAQARADEAEQRFLESYVPESLVTGRGPTPEQRRALMNKAGLTGARLQLERARYEQDRAIVRSPVAGTVDLVEVAVGEKLSAGQILLTVVDLSHLRIDAQVLEHDLPLIRVGGKRWCRVPVRPAARCMGASMPCCRWSIRPHGPGGRWCA